MKKTVLLVLAAVLVMMSGCQKWSITTYKGVVVEGSTKTPIPNVKVALTNGSHEYCTTTTNDKGEFELVVDFDDVTPDYYFQFEGDPSIPVRTLQIRGKGVKTYDYHTVALYTEKSGVFSISDSQKVRFAMGNLQYQASTNTWRFAENAYDFVGEDNSKISSNYSGWIDLFGWGTSGYDHGANCFQPWSTSRSDADYMAYGGYQSLFDMSGQADWGYNAILNGGNHENQWRTLTRFEWDYLLGRDLPDSDFSYSCAYVGDVMGLVILPDNWDVSTYQLSSGDASNDEFENECSKNKITYDEWKDKLEPAGAVFLPQAGKRIGTEYYPLGNGAEIGERANISYWTSNSSSENAYVLIFRRLNYTSVAHKSYGLSVRLVQEL